MFFADSVVLNSQRKKNTVVVDFASSISYQDAMIGLPSHCKLSIFS